MTKLTTYFYPGRKSFFLSSFPLVVDFTPFLLEDPAFVLDDFLFLLEDEEALAGAFLLDLFEGVEGFFALVCFLGAGFLIFFGVFFLGASSYYSESSAYSSDSSTSSESCSESSC